MWHWGWGSWWMVVGMVGFWGLIGWAIWLGMRSPRPSGRTGDDILAERFARGEIGADEYEERRRVLAKR